MHTMFKQYFKISQLKKEGEKKKHKVFLMLLATILHVIPSIILLVPYLRSDKQNGLSGGSILSVSMVPKPSVILASKHHKGCMRDVSSFFPAWKDPLCRYSLTPGTRDASSVQWCVAACRLFAWMQDILTQPLSKLVLCLEKKGLESSHSQQPRCTFM